MRRRRVPLHRSLLARLLAASVLVALCAVAATAWIAVTTTTSALRTEQGQSLADDIRIHDTLIGYAAGHRSWDGVQGLVTRLAADTGRAITLTTPSRTRIADSGLAQRPLPARPSAQVDPLHPDTALADDRSSIDPRAVGPYRLTKEERRRVREAAEKAILCLRESGAAPQVVESPSGRLDFRFTDPGLGQKASAVCQLAIPREPQPSQHAVLRELAALTATCLKLKEPDVIKVADDLTWQIAGPGQETVTDTAAQACVDDSRRKQLRPHVAPPALLFVGAPGDLDEPIGFTPSAATMGRIAAAAGLVLAVAVALTVAIGLRLIRPLRSLIAAAQQPAEQIVQVPVRTHDEIGHLTAAFNDLAERRQQLEEQRKSMVADVAHELRSPLTNIRSWLEAAEDGLTPTDHRLLALLLDEAVLLQRVIDDLTDLAAADAGELTLHIEQLRTADVLDRVVSAHRSTAEQAGVRLDQHVTGDTHEAYADPMRLQQIIGNLVSNAVRHTPSGGRVTLRSLREEHDILLEVEDTGSGIPPEELPYLFDRFWRAEKSRSRRTGGSGLGLSIARKLAEAHGGSITAHSTLGEGSTFTLRLPHASECEQRPPSMSS
ncbi:sensor histidine kinase [Streptomyces sp. NPDC058375]|uniref:sensor histidine kinase n=1 Tax=Streptomyces sp. NPDC058375 TaxID=3346467 RepID=UPI00364A01D6